MTVFRTSAGGLELAWSPGAPVHYEALAARADLVDVVPGTGDQWCLTVRRAAEPWPFLVVRAPHPASEGGDPVAALVCPDADTLFVGSGDHALVYGLAPARRIGTFSAESGFHVWRRVGSIVLMSAELEFAAWTVHGSLLWTRFVEPPWDYEVRGSTIELDVMGRKSSFAIDTGPAF